MSDIAAQTVALMPRLRDMARRYANKMGCSDYADDLQQAAAVALLEFPPPWNEGQAIVTARHAMTNALRQVLPVSASWGTVHKYSEIAHASRELWRQLQRQPFDEEIAAEAGCGVATVLAFREAFGARPVSPETVTEGGEVQEILTDPRPSQEEVLQLKELQADVARVVEQLTPVQRECIVLRFGLDGNEAHGVGWIAAHRGVCRNSVHVAIRLATKALQDALREWDAA